VTSYLLMYQRIESLAKQGEKQWKQICGRSLKRRYEQIGHYLLFTCGHFSYGGTESKDIPIPYLLE